MWQRAPLRALVGIRPYAAQMPEGEKFSNQRGSVSKVLT
jgi:hypothetical protein